MSWLRSRIFEYFLFFWVFFLAIIGIPLLLLSLPAILLLGRYGTYGVVLGLRWIVGVKWVHEGQENLPDGPCIIACQHQSMLETLLFYILCKRPCYVLKQELLNIPLINLYMRKVKVIAVDRSAGRAALKMLVTEAKQRISVGRQVIIYPEGTRMPMGELGDFKGGLTALNRAMPDVPIVPMAICVGHVWPRKSGGKRSGVAITRFLPPTTDARQVRASIESVQAELAQKAGISA